MAHLDVKRLYLPFFIKAICPKCGVPVEHALDDRYLSYPPINQPFVYSFSHDIDDGDDWHEWDVTIRLDVTVTAVADCTVEAS
jgi:hypothetical protein